MANRYVLVGLRPANDYGESFAERGRKVLALLRPFGGGRRITAEISQRDCTDWPTCRRAIAAFLNKDGVKRLDESEIDKPDAIDLPWGQEMLQQIEDGKGPRLIGGRTESASQSTRNLDKTARKFYNAEKPTSRAYAGAIKGDANFSADGTLTPAEQIEQNNRQIESLKAEIEAARMMRSIEFNRTADCVGEELLAVAFGVEGAAHSQDEHDRLLSLTPLGRARLEQRREVAANCRRRA